MQVHALPAAAGRPAGPLRRHLPWLIELSGTPKFEMGLFAAAREASRCEHLTAFVFSGSTPPRVLIAANTGSLPVAHIVAEKYVFRYWMLDPARQVEVKGPSDFAVQVRSDEIDNSGYRYDCYTEVGLQDRVSIVKRRDGDVVRLNFYKSTGSGHFAPEEIEHIFEVSDLMMALLTKHDAVALPPRGPEAVPSFERRLRLVGRTLPRREIEVCTLIAAGMSSEGIALKLGISLNTVLTHRKRAYARLGISSQNELLRLLLS